MPDLRSTALWIAVCALALRSLVPIGWMPNTGVESHSVLMPCPMMDGMRGRTMPPEPVKSTHPAKHQLPVVHEGSICPFATAASPIQVIEPHRVAIAVGHSASFGPAVSISASDWDHVPRAPPASI